MVLVCVRSFLCPCGFTFTTTEPVASAAHRHGDQEVPMQRQADQWR